MPIYLPRDLDHIVDQLVDDFAAMAGKRLLITGGAGFLGYYLVQSVLHWNDRVVEDQRIHTTVFDNYVRGVPPWLEELGRRSDLTTVRHDVRQPLPDPMPDFEFIVHAAGIASPTYYRAHPLETMDANIDGLRMLLEYARDRVERGLEVGGFIFYSSSEIYGDPAPDRIPTSEDYRGNVSCTGPRACYDESKRYGETLCSVFAQHYGVPVRMVAAVQQLRTGTKDQRSTA